MICIMQKESFEIRWTKARQLEASGDVPAAIETYEAILKDEPNRLYARLRVSTLLQMQDKYRRARQHAVDAVESVRHSRWNDLPYVTSKLLTFDEQQLLLEVIRGADWKHRDVITASPMLVQHLWLAGSVDEAVRLAETALQVAPSHLQLNYAYGIALGYAGRLDEAAAAFEKCLVIDPGYAAAHWSLAYTRKRAGTEVDRAKPRAPRSSIFAEPKTKTLSDPANCPTLGDIDIPSDGPRTRTTRQCAISEISKA